MGARVETERGFMDHFIDLSADPKSFLVKLERILDWSPFERYLKKNVKRSPVAAAGQPAYPDLAMFKILLLQYWYNLSDERVSEEVRDRMSFLRFTGLSFHGSKPDGSTVCRFRGRLVEKGHYRNLLDLLNQQLDKNDMTIRHGAVVDATLVESSRHPRKSLEVKVEDVERKEDECPEGNVKEAVKEAEVVSAKVRYSDDEEATWTVKRGRPIYGFKVHMVVEGEHGLILGGHVTGANVSDTVEMKRAVEESRLPEGVRVNADKGYSSEDNRIFLTDNKYQDGIMRKASRGHPLLEEDKQWNKEISKTRWIVERSFGTLKKAQNFVRARYLGRAKVELEFFLQALAHNLRKVVNLAP